MNYQFYPTPLSLAEHAWSLFKNREFSRVLEPSAGTGDLMLPQIDRSSGSRGAMFGQGYTSSVTWDAIEVDSNHHAKLRERGGKIVGHDFLSFKGGDVYSHIIMNPPFAQGAQHLLHAWQILYEGEIVCILNAETIKNPFSNERALLARLIAQYGSVHYIENAFNGSDVVRQTDVEIAVVHLVKKADVSTLVGDILSDLRTDNGVPIGSSEFAFANQLTLPQGFVEDLVLRFNAAVVAAKEAAMAEAKAGYYRKVLGSTLSERNSSGFNTEKVSPEAVPKHVRALFATQYAELKDRAWSGVLRSTEVLSKLSSKAQRRLESEFESIKELEFTTSNVFGFLCGLCEAANEIQTEMVLDVFDEIVRYHADNTVFYMGWKSNSKHRTAGMRLKTSRFVIPGHTAESWCKSLRYESRRQLSDFDRVFAMLDGKHESATFGLVKLFDEKYASLSTGNRESCDYFDVRYYPKRGTIHFFPKSKELMDRLNRLVGAQRQWLPPNMAEASADFTYQYENAEKFDKEVRAKFESSLTHTGRYTDSAGYLLNSITGKGSQCESDSKDKAQACLSEALTSVLEAHGIQPFEAIEYSEPQQLLLLAA